MIEEIPCVQLDQLFPMDAAVLEAKVASALEGELVGVELQAIEDWTRYRRAEFATGRALARGAMRQLGFPEAPIKSGSQGEPIWPKGLIGSITHKNRRCVAAVARQTDAQAIGIDLESSEEIEAAAIEDIVESTELHSLRRVLPAESDGWLANLAFAAKEATFKAQFPLTHDSSVDFSDVVLSFDRDRSGVVFSNQILRGFRSGMIVGRAISLDRWVIAAVTIPLQ